MSDGNDTESRNQCFSQLSEEQLAGAEAIAMDMSAAFVKSAKASIPLAEERIVHDRFHVMTLASDPHQADAAKESGEDDPRTNRKRGQLLHAWSY
ncbi:MAG: transposase [Rubripirellula sp.]